MVEKRISGLVKFLITSIIVGIILGLVGASAAHYFRAGISFAASIFSGYISPSLGFFHYFLTLTIALTIVHMLKKLIAPNPCQGVADSIFYAHRPDNEADIKNGLVSTCVAFISASGGASVGQYGPLVHFGATIGSWLRQTLPFKISLDLYIGGGVAAAISSGFGAPLAGLVFAHEAIMRHYSHTAILSIAIASGVAYGMSASLWGNSVVFEVAQNEFDFLSILLISFLAGPFFGIVAVAFMKSLLFFNTLSAKSSISTLQKYTVGILALSVIGHFIPQAMGLGSEAVLSAVEGEWVLYFAILVLCAKILSTSISLGFGFFGGVFSPAILVGASAGAVVASGLVELGVMDQFEPAIVISGMAAVTGAVIGAPICMIIIVLELTSSYTFALSSLVGLALSVSLSQIMFGSSFFDKQLALRGIDISMGRAGMFLMERSILTHAQKDFLYVNDNVGLKRLKKIFSEQNVNEIIVLNRKGQLRGKVDLYKIIETDLNEAIEEYIEKDCISIKHDASIQQAMEVASDFVGESIPIVDRNNNTVVATITEGAIFEAYLNVQNSVIDLEKR